MTRTVEQLVCDVCRTNSSYSGQACLRCKKLVCYECMRKWHAVEFRYSPHVSGGDDGRYCKECIAVLTTNPDALFLAYAAMAGLIAEYKSYQADFERRSAEAEANIHKLRAGLKEGK